MGVLANIVKTIESWFHIDNVTTMEQKTAFLNKKAQENPETLNWSHSIVDLLKLTGQDSSLHARVALAKEMGFEGTFTGTAEQNLWLHQKVMDHLKIFEGEK